MANRRALLIGVPRYDDETFDDIGTIVRADLRVMRETLAQSQFDVSECGVGGSHGEATSNRINRDIKSACAEAPAGGVLLIYFSGHGVTIDDQDYLAPSDAYRMNGELDTESLVPVIPAGLAACRARLVVYFVDACRDDPRAARLPARLGGQLPFTSDGDFVLVTGCGPGQVCRHTESGSVFTQALAQALDHRHPARTLSQVLDAVTTDMKRRSRQGGVEQLPEVRYPAVLASAGPVVICEGDELTAAWRKVVDSTGLLQPYRDGETADPALIERVRSIVDECARQCGAAQGTLLGRTGMKDPWTDQNYPGRVLQQAELLLAGYPRLRPGEATMMVAAPFLREAVLAAGIREAAGIDPGDLRRTYHSGPRSDLEITHEMHQHVVRRAEGLRRPGAAESRDQLVMWLVHRWLSSRSNLWESPDAGQVFALGQQLIEDCRGDAAMSEVPRLVQLLLRAIGAEPVDDPLVDRLRSDYVDDRWRGMAAVLWLAGIMAADLRRVPAVVPDLIGTRMEISLIDMQNAAGRNASWQWSGRSLDLHLTCEHPALHDAFENLVRQADRARETIAARLTIPPALGELLPRQITATRLRPELRSDGDRAYEVPLSRFQIAEDKVRELLMGRQLYDDPALAIRELYQNALDACRWRQTRHEYLARTGRYPGSWEGRIRFRQGFDGVRYFIECEDNGVGMDTNTLERVFGNAGERFVFGQAFRAEQAGWQELTPPLRMVSNSQFGVGVFSYFMLADEMTVTTRHVRRDGLVEPRAHVVHIASSGSLFQIAPSEDLPEGGTRVVLYLRDEEDVLSVSVLRALRGILWVAEHVVEATEEPNAREVWKPSELRYHDETAVSLRHGRDLWWVSDEGGLAADGIRTNEEMFGLIVNLRDERRPQFTVDRKTLRAWDREWVADEIRASLPGLMGWAGFTLSWLWQVAESRPEIAQQIFEYAAAGDHLIKVGTSWGHSASVRAGTVGCLPEDARLFETKGYYFWSVARWFAAWRAGVWKGCSSAPATVPLLALAENTEGFPVPEPVDAELLGRLDTYQDDQRPTVDAILLALAHPTQTAASQLRRLRRFAITGLDLTAIRYVPPVEATFEDEDDDVPLLRAFAAWSPPGEPPRQAVAGPLVKASVELDQPLGEVLGRARRLAPPGWSAPDLDLGELADYTCTSADATLLSQGIDGDAPWAEGELTPAHLVAVSDDLGRSLDQVLALCDHLAPLGVSVARRDAYPDDPGKIELEALREVTSPGRLLNPLGLARVAARAGVSCGEAHRGLARLEERHLLARPDLGGGGELVPGARELKFIDRDMSEFSSQATGQPTDLVEAPHVDIVWTLKLKGARQGKLPSPASLLAPLTAPAGPVTLPELAKIAYYLEGTLAGARAALLTVYPEADVPSLSPQCADLTVPWEAYYALWGPRTGRAVASWGTSPVDIIGGASNARLALGDYLAQLNPFRALGAPVPANDETTRAALNEIVPDEYDEDLLTVFDEFGEECHLRTVSALDLVRAAGRLGWTPARTHRRLAALAPLGLTLAYPGGDLPDEVVRWQDLLLLTRHLDGQPPAVTGTADEAHLNIVARETGEPVDWLRGRLSVYAQLFELSHAEESSDAARPDH